MLSYKDKLLVRSRFRNGGVIVSLGGMTGLRA